MENSTSNNSCTTRCWQISAVIGIVIALWLLISRDWGFIQSAFLGLLIFVIGGALCSWLFCNPEVQSSGTDKVMSAASAADTSASTDVAVADASTASADSSSSNTSTGGSGIKPSAELVGTKELADRKGDWKYVKPETEAVKPVAKAAAKKAPAKKAGAKTTKTAAKSKASGADAKTSTAPVAKVAASKATAKSTDTTAKAATAKKTVAKATTAKVAPAKAATAKATVAKTATPKTAVKTAVKAAKATAPKAAAAKSAVLKRAPVAADGKPETLKKARAGGADDLKQLKGVGPALETTLNELGFYHFDQVAAWRKKEIEWVDGNLRFKGRIERDEWIKQAKTLAKGGTTEFSSKVKKGGVY